MKMVLAFIRPDRLMDVTLALEEIEGLSGLSIGDIRGFGRGRGKTAETREQQLFDFQPKVRLEVVCNDQIVDRIVEAIEREANTGRHGDGKIMVSNLETCVRISTGERGTIAI